jgi:hexulose-6-phosphate isomerase
MEAFVSRRTFMGMTAGFAAAGALPVSAQIATRTPRSIRKAVKLGMVQVDGTIAEKFALLRELGYDGVEIDSPSQLDLDEVIAARDDTGLIVHGVVDSAHWRLPLSHPDQAVRDQGRAALETALHDCKRCGGDTVLLVPAVVNKDVSYADAYARSQSEIQRVLPLAQELQLTIALENVWNNFLLSPLEAARYVDELESPWVRWYFDVGNVVRYGWPEQWVTALGPRLIKLDVKEYSRAKQRNEGLWKGFDVKIGDGDCDWPAVMAALDRIEFSGWATAEVGGGGRERLADIAKRMDTVLQS